MEYVVLSHNPTTGWTGYFCNGFAEANSLATELRKAHDTVRIVKGKVIAEWIKE